MQAITVRDRDAGIGGLSLTDMPYPHATENDVIVRVHAAGFTPGERDWPGTWSDRAGRDRTPKRARARTVGCRRRVGVWHHRPYRRPAGIRTDRLDP